MAFTPKRYDSGKLTKDLRLVSGQTVAKGDALEDKNTGFFQRWGTSVSPTSVQYVAMEALTGTSANEHVLAIRTQGVEFEADTDSNPSQTDVGTTADLTDHDTLNENASSNDVFFITRIKGAVSDKKVRGFFVSDKAT